MFLVSGFWHFPGLLALPLCFCFFLLFQCDLERKALLNAQDLGNHIDLEVLGVMFNFLSKYV